MGHATLLRRLLPPTSYNPNAPRLSVSVDMEGKELDRVLADAPHAVGALRPFTYQEWLEDYERIYGLARPLRRGRTAFAGAHGLACRGLARTRRHFACVA